MIGIVVPVCPVCKRPTEATARLSGLGMGISALSASHPIHRSVIEAQEAQQWLLVFTQGRLWTNQRRQECWERAKHIRAGALYPMAMKSAIVQAVQEMEREWEGVAGPSTPPAKASRTRANPGSR